jgi:hypothetical protein
VCGNATVNREAKDRDRLAAGLHNHRTAAARLGSFDH